MSQTQWELMLKSTSLKEIVAEIRKLRKSLDEKTEQFAKGGSPSEIVLELRNLAKSLDKLYKKVEDYHYPQRSLDEFS